MNHLPAEQIAHLTRSSTDYEAAACEAEHPQGHTGKLLSLRGHAADPAEPRMAVVAKGVRTQMTVVKLGDRVEGWVACHEDKLWLQWPVKPLFGAAPDPHDEGVRTCLKRGKYFWRQTLMVWQAPEFKYQPAIIVTRLLGWRRDEAGLVIKTRTISDGARGIKDCVSDWPVSNFLEEFHPLDSMLSKNYRLCRAAEYREMALGREVGDSPPLELERKYARSVLVLAKCVLKFVRMLRAMRERDYSIGGVGFKRARERFEAAAASL